MKQWIRWSGLLGFIVITAILVLAWLFAVGPIIKYSIESFGSKAAKAKVEVADVSLTFDPFGIEISGVQVADADNPMENVIQFERAVADIDVFPLLLGKGIVNQLTLTGVAFATPRDISGALAASEVNADGQTDNTDASSDADGRSVNDTHQSSRQASPQALPSADELLAREPLLTEQRGREFEKSLNTIKTDSDSALAALPSSEDFAAYEDEFNRLTSARFDSLQDFQQRKKEFERLKKRIKEDQKAIKHAQTVLSQGRDSIKQQWSVLQDSPEQDFNQLKSKYQLDGAGVANLSRLMFGDTVGEWAEEGLHWYEKIRPFLISDSVDEDTANGVALAEKQRQEGRFVHFASDRPLPDLLIKKVQLAVNLPQNKGQVAINVYDITHQQRVTNKPIRLVAVGENLNGMRALSVKGTLDYRGDIGQERFDLIVQELQVTNYNVGAMGLILNQSQVDVAGQAQLTAGELDAKVKAEFSQASFTSKDNTQLAKEMVLALKKIDRFNINASAKGELISPKVEIGSDLDQKLNSAFNQRVKDKQKELEQQLKRKLNDKLLSYAGSYKEQLNGMGLADESLANQQGKLKNLAKTELSSFEDQQKAEAQQKLDAKREAEKAKAKAAADKKRKQLEKDAKEKFKRLF